MTLNTIGWAVIAVMHLYCFSNAELPGDPMPSVSEQGAKVRPVFAVVPNADGWYTTYENGDERMYKVFVQKATWDEAEAICSNNKAHLASVGSEEENDFIYELAKIKTATERGQLLWLGGKQRNYPSSKDWSWSDGEPFSYTNWYENEPNDIGSEQCLQMYNLPYGIVTMDNLLEAKKWNDINCGTKMDSFICKK